MASPSPAFTKLTSIQNALDENSLGLIWIGADKESEYFHSIDYLLDGLLSRSFVPDSKPALYSTTLYARPFFLLAASNGAEVKSLISPLSHFHSPHADQTRVLLIGSSDLGAIKHKLTSHYKNLEFFL
jgi:hypothetical protein